MSQLITTISVAENFWELNPSCKYVFHYLDHNEETSNLMWAYTYVYHPNSPYFEEPEYKRIEYARNYLDNQEWNPDDNNRLNTDFLNGCLSRLQKTLVKWGAKVDERIEFIANNLPDFRTRIRPRVPSRGRRANLRCLTGIRCRAEHVSKCY